MKVLSLFDGISCGRVALERAGFSVSRYVAYEIDKWAKLVSEFNYPDIEQRGNVEFADWREFEGFDLVMGGFPCTDLSIAGKREGLKGKHSSLFWELVHAIKTVNPKYFLVENNYGMPKKVEAIITDTLGVNPIMINSALVSAQERKRLYWTNIPNVNQPEDKGILLKDVIESRGLCYPGAIRGRQLKIGTIVGRRLDDRGVRKDSDKSIKTTQCLEVRKSKDKSNCLTTVEKDNVLSDLPAGRYPDAYGKYRKHFRPLTPVEYERLQTLPDYYTELVSDTQRLNCLGNGWTVDVIAHILNNMEL